MAKLICENGDYLEFYSFRKTRDDEYSPDCSFSVYVKSRAFSGAAEVSTFLPALDNWYRRMTEICQNYEGAVTIQNDDYDYDIATVIHMEYTSQGYLRISGKLVEDWCDDSQQLLFFTTAPVGNFDTFLPELKSEIDRLKG